MQLLIPLLEISAIILSLIVLWRAAKTAPASKDSVQALGRRLKAQLVSDDPTAPTFIRPDFQARLEGWNTVGALRPEFRVVVKWNRPLVGRLTLQTRSTFDPILGSMPEVSTGDREFGGLYLLRGAPEGFVHEIVTPEIRKAIRAVGRLGPIDIRIVAGGMQFRSRMSPSSEREREQWLETFAVAAFDLAESAAQSGQTEVLIISSSTSAADVHCQVCGSDLAGRIVTCSKCGTPHHEDCWTYNGRCATYACGSLVLREPR